MGNRKILLGHLALLGVQMLYAGNYSIAKNVMPDYIEPLGIVFLRVSFGMVMFWLFQLLFIKKSEKTVIQKADFPRLIACALFGIAINQMTFFIGLNWTSPINASIIMLTTPIIVFIGAVLFLKERFINLNILGILIGCLGASILIGYGNQINFNPQGLKGDLLILTNATFFSIYLLISQSLFKKYNAFVVLKWVFTFGFLLCLPFTYPVFAKANLAAIPFSIWLDVAYILVGATFLTYLFNAFALVNLPAKTVGAYIYLQPILATGIALLLGKDELTIIKIITGSLIFLGVFLASKKHKGEI